MSESQNESGVYKITCTLNGKFYIGSTVNFQKRWRNHISQLRNAAHWNSRLQKAWDQYGEAAFVFEVLELCNRETLRNREQYYLDTWQPFNEQGFNISRIAAKPHSGYVHRTEMTYQTRTKISAAKRGHVVTAESRTKISAKLKNRKLSPETRTKMSQSRKGNSHCKGKGRLQRAGIVRTRSPRCEYTYILIDPEGNVIETHNLRQFSISHNLNKGAMYQVVLGKRNHHKGWKVKRIP